MTLQPYEHYAAIGSANAYKRWGGWMKFLVGGLSVLGGVIGYATLKNVGAPLAGVVVGGLIGYGIYRLIVYLSAKSSADDLYSFEWCAARGMRNRKDGVFPTDAPYARSGDSREAEDIYEGHWNGLDTLFYNFTYVVRGRGKDDTDDYYRYKIMRLRGVTLPIARLTIHQRSFGNRFEWVDKLQGKLTPERPVSLESADFNAKFDLTIDDAADDIWIRRIFDPSTIQTLVDGSFTIPDLKYYNGAWWFVETNHFATRDLEQWVTKQKIAADAIAHLARVQEL